MRDRELVRKLVIGILVFLMGSLTGVFGSAWWMQESFQQLNEIGAMHNIAAESEEAMNQYRSGKPEVAQYAIERYIVMLERYEQKNLKLMDAKMLSGDIALGYTRLGQLAENMGDSKRASEAYSKGLVAYSRSASKPSSIDDLKRLVKHLDDAAQNSPPPVQ